MSECCNELRFNRNTYETIKKNNLVNCGVSIDLGKSVVK